MPSQHIIIPILPKDKDFPAGKGEKMLTQLKMWMQGGAKRKLVSAFEDTTQGWREKPNFPGEYSEPYGTQLQLYVHPKGQGTTNWQRVSDGTGPRSIVSRKGVMHFQTGYAPRTRPGGWSGGSGIRFGPTMHTRVVQNHRIEPRKFSEEIVKKIGKSLADEAQVMIRKALQ